MQVAIPPEFEAFAREQVEPGTFASTEEAVAVALRDYLARVEEPRALIDEGLNSGDPVDGREVFERLLAELRGEMAGRPDSALNS